MLDITPLPPELQELLREPRPARRVSGDFRHGELHGAACQLVEDTDSSLTASILEVALSSGCFMCHEDPRLGHYQAALRELAAADPDGSDAALGHVSFAALTSIEHQARFWPAELPELAPLLENALTGIEATRHAHLDWVKGAGVVALVRHAGAMAHYGHPASWSRQMSSAVTASTCDPSLEIAELRSTCDRLSAREGFLVVSDLGPYFTTSLSVSSALSDVLAEFMVAPGAMVVPRSLEPLFTVDHPTGLYAQQHRLAVLGPDEPARVRETLTTLLRDGVHAEEALVMARLL